MVCALLILCDIIGGIEQNAQTAARGAEKDRLGRRKCRRNRVCFSENDCKGGKCAGSFVGKCDCTACINFATCTDDSGCGGLKYACRNGICDCIAAYKANGLTYYVDALRELCNVAKCDGENPSACFGLPCNAGHCEC